MSPFKSTKQMRYMFAKHPTIAKKWIKKYGKPGKSKNEYSEELAKGGK